MRSRLRAGAQTQIASIRATGDLGEPPVHHVRLAELADHHVRRLQVAVGDALGVSVGDRLADARQDAEGARSAPAFLPLTGKLEHGFQIASLHQTHREEQPPLAIDADVVKGHDAGVVQLSGDLRLVQESVRERVARRASFTGRRAPSAP